MARSDPRPGQERPTRLVPVLPRHPRLAVVVLRDGATATEQEIIEHCRGLIAGYKCPKQVLFRDTPLPKSGPGKILKTELRKPYWEGKDRKVN